MLFYGGANGMKMMKGTLSEKETVMSDTTGIQSCDTTLKKKETHKKKESHQINILDFKASNKPTRLLKVKIDKSWKINQILETIKFPLKQIDTKKGAKGVLGLCFFSLNDAKQIYNALAELEIVKEISFRKNPCSFEHSDCVLFDNRFNLSENNILRFLEMIDKVAMLKKLSLKRYLVKFDSICIPQNIQKVMGEYFWQFDKRYYQSVICFTEENYDHVYINLTNPIRLKFCNLEEKNKYKNFDTNINFRAIIDEQDLRTTIMIKNIPNRIQKKDLIELINQKFYGTYDFLYLPIDFQV
jgi:hypothetical protein